MAANINQGLLYKSNIVFGGRHFVLLLTDSDFFLYFSDSLCFGWLTIMYLSYSKLVGVNFKYVLKGTCKGCSMLCKCQIFDI